MIKILTAIGNENLNNCLRQENEFDVLEKDIVYREGILEYLEKNSSLDFLIIYEKLDGEIKIIDLIKNIKKINNEIKIFFILEKKNEILENLLKIENINNIFYNEEININKFIEQLKNKKNNNEERLKQEINRLKKIINNKDEELLKLKNKNDSTKEYKKTIVITGIQNDNKKKICESLIRFSHNKYNFINIDINNFIEIENLNKNVYKYIFLIENNLEKIKINRIIIKKMGLKNKINLKKINILFIELEKKSINKKIIKNIFYDFKILGNIKIKNNKKNNEKKYLKIIKKI